MSPAGYEAFIGAAFVGERVLIDDIRIVVIDGPPTASLPSPGVLPIVVAQIGEELGVRGAGAADLVVGENDMAWLANRVRSNPVAATSLAVLLRHSEQQSVDSGLAAESAVYSMLQGSAEFARWRGTTQPHLVEESGPVVRLSRCGNDLMIVLDRPHKHNAMSRQLRDELCDGLRAAIADDSLRSITVTGRGSSFCSGGDLSEFGGRLDPAGAHLIRLAQSPGRLIHTIRDKATIRIHGASLGGGIEMAAFAGRVVADPETRIGLPETGLGLIPGAGGTVSLTRRIGRQRTLALALGTDTIDAETALLWGLVDQIEDVHG